MLKPFSELLPLTQILPQIARALFSSVLAGSVPGRHTRHYLPSLKANIGVLGVRRYSDIGVLGV